MENIKTFVKAYWIKMKQNSVLIQFTGIALTGVESMTNFSYTLYIIIALTYSNETNFKSEQREVTVSESILW